MNKPVELMVPQFAVQLDGVLAVNCWVPPSVNVTVDGETVIANRLCAVASDNTPSTTRRRIEVADTCSSP